MSFDRSLARCSFCGRRPPAVQRMVAGPGAAYICEECLNLCNEILADSMPFSAKALELASRPPVVIAAPQETGKAREPAFSREPLRTIVIQLEQKQQGMTLMLHQLQLFAQHFELHYLWIRPPLSSGFAFVPRLIFKIVSNTGTEWLGDRGGRLIARQELASDPDLAVYQGNARFTPVPASEVREMIVLAADPLAQFSHPPLAPWRFEISLPA
ncbi:MAG TPA: ClpX C4-type zinc finger protein [Ktedonobacteraceae bacterium]|nr:ClpX C4-type zinc finger protein [Ktedonobacteraceae bacterium]